MCEPKIICISSNDLYVVTLFIYSREIIVILLHLKCMIKKNYSNNITTLCSFLREK